MLITAAIIDDGISRENSFGIRVSKALEFAQGIVRPDVSPSFLTHGTMCARIIRLFHSRSYDLVSLKVVSTGKKGTVKDLAAALNWCLEHDVKLIHIGVGTANYHDFSTLNTCVNALYRRGSIMVSAYHNRNIPTCPACLPHVFGVRRDRLDKLKSGEWGFESLPDVRPENTLVAGFDQKILGDCGNYSDGDAKRANSFAAPVVTGNLLGYLSGNPDSSFEQALDYLRKRASNTYTGFPFFDNSLIPDREPEALTIGVNGGSPAKCIDLADEFLSRGYRVEIFQGPGKEEISRAVPLGLYRIRALDKKRIYLLSRIYDADVLLFLNCLVEAAGNTRGLFSADIFLPEQEEHWKISLSNGRVHYADTTMECCDIMEKEFAESSALKEDS